MKKLLLLPILLVLGACSTFKLITGSSVSPNAVYIAANTFDTLVISAATYDRLPLCSTGISYACRTLATVKVVDRAIRDGRALRNQLIAYVVANPGEVVPVSNYNALVSVIGTVQAYISAAGVSK